MPGKAKGKQTEETPSAAASGSGDTTAAEPAGEAVTQAAAARAKAANDPRMVESLLAERRGYVMRGMGDRVALVDEQIRFYGGQPPAEDQE